MAISKKKKVTLVSSKDVPNKNKSVNLVSEHYLSLYVNRKFVYKFSCVEKHLDELVVGWLRANKYINNFSDIKSLSFAKSKSKVYISIRPNKNKKINNFQKPNYEKDCIFELVNKFLSGTTVYKRTNGTHCCILSVKGKIKLSREDLGRFNAIDKVIGYITINDIDLCDCILFSSGRISADLVEKLINCGLPILVSKSVPTCEAVEASKGNLTLICKAWPDSYEIYS